MTNVLEMKEISYLFKGVTDPHGIHEPMMCMHQGRRASASKRSIVETKTDDLRVIENAPLLKISSTASSFFRAR